MATVIAYVDGFNLYHGLHDKYRRRYLWLDLAHLVQRLRPEDRIVAVRYFTALVRDDPSGLLRQQTYLDALRAHSGSVNIAVSIVAGTAAAASDLALIVSADSDLCPAIRTARSLGQSRGVIAAFPPRRSSFEIRSLIPRAFTIAAADLRNSLLPDSVIDPATGRVHKRPSKWR